MGAGKGTVYPWTADDKGLPVGFSGLSYGQDVGLQLTIAQQHTAVVCPADTAENTLFSYTIPGGLMGPNDSLRISVIATNTSSANLKTVRIRFDGTVIRSQALNTGSQWSIQIRVSARNSTQQQVVQVLPDASSVLPLVSPFKDMTTPTLLTVTGQLGLGSESLTLESVLVELLRGA
jgi:hypothetical protein